MGAGEHPERPVAGGVTRRSGLLPHLAALALAVGPLGLDPRLRQLVTIAVCRSAGCRPVALLHSALGRLAGVTRRERLGAIASLTAAERSAVAFALDAVHRPDPTLAADPAEEHYTEEELDQLRAVATAVDATCRLATQVGSLFLQRP